MNLFKFLAMKLHQGPVFIDGMVRPKSVVVPESIDAMRHLIFQDRHVTYRGIEITLGISIKQICSRWIPYNLSIAQIKTRVDWSKGMLQKYDSGASKHVFDIVMNRGFTRMSPKVNSSRLYGCFKMSQIQQKLLAHEALPNK